MIVRIRSRDGSYRFELNPTDDISALVAKISETSSTIDPSTLALSNRPAGGETLVSGITGNLQALGINHGDLLFVTYTPLSVPIYRATTPPAPIPSTSSTLSGKIVQNPVKEESIVPSVPKIEPSAGDRRVWEEAREREEEVDKFWDKKEGKIERKKGENGCRCGPKSMCDYCMPLEPYDAEYQANHKIKHLSFHSYLRKINSSAPLSSQSATWIPPLSDPKYTVSVPCSSGSHPSWPAGICTKCQPSAVTLSRQTYRLVDHVEFADPSLIETLIDFWRRTGTQRFGYLLGKYEKYEEVPMGVKAVVEAIHEPPQEPHQDGVTVGFPWVDEANVERIAEACGLKVVGVIYTDLVPDKDNPVQGKVIPKRHANSFFLSSLEVLFSAALQRSHPNISHYSPSGKFSSKFVTCVVSGDLDGNVAIESYQVSDQSVAMLEADMIEASVEPGTMRVKEEGEGRYVPDVFYRYKNMYGIEVKESAKPCFPVEYLLVNVTHGFPVSTSPLFSTKTPFVPENRTGLADQSMTKVTSSFATTTKGLSDDALVGEGKLKDEDAKKVIEWISDWHLLVFLDGCGIFEPTDIQTLATLARTKSTADLKKFFQTPNWQTFLIVLREQAPGPAPPPQPQQPMMTDDGFEIPPDVDMPPGQDVNMGDAGGSGGMVVCPHCTFENAQGSTDCDICGLPLSG